VTQEVVEVEVYSEGSFLATQEVIEIDVDLSGAGTAQFTLAATIAAVPPTTSSGSYLFQAKIIPTSTVDDYFFFMATLRRTFIQSNSYVFEALITDHDAATPRSFSFEAKIQKKDPDDIPYYPDFPDPEGSHEDFAGYREVRLLDHSGNTLLVIDNYTYMEYVRAVNGQFWHEDGWYILNIPKDNIDITLFKLDYIIQVRRVALDGTYVVVFEGLHRNRQLWQDDDGILMFSSAGPDLRDLIKRRVVMPITADQAFLSISGPFTNIMRDLVALNSVVTVYGDRRIWRLNLGVHDDYGVPITMNYQYTPLINDLNALCDIGLGADWDVYQDGNAINFRVYYPRRGRDRQRGNGVHPEMIWSLDRNTIIKPAYSLDRTNESTVAFVAGEGIGSEREIVTRTNIVGNEDDSPWNRIETFLDGAQETSTAALNAYGDAYLVANGMIEELAIEIAPREALSYGYAWNLGDICTAEFGDRTFKCRIVQVRVILDATAETDITIMPRFLMYPNIDTY